MCRSHVCGTSVEAGRTSVAQRNVFGVRIHYESATPRNIYRERREGIPACLRVNVFHLVPSSLNVTSG